MERFRCGVADEVVTSRTGAATCARNTHITSLRSTAEISPVAALRASLTTMEQAHRVKIAVSHNSRQDSPTPG